MRVDLLTRIADFLENVLDDEHYDHGRITNDELQEQQRNSGVFRGTARF